MLFEKLFKKEKPVCRDLIEISQQHVATGQMGAYLKKLHDEEGFRHMGYRFEKHGGLGRYVIYAIFPNDYMVQYFKDRCPAMVEMECRQLEGIPHKWIQWKEGEEDIKEIRFEE